MALLFFVLLLIKKGIKKRIKKRGITEWCVLCAAVSVTWMILLLLYFLGLFSDTIIIAILLGQTSVGIFYLLEKKVPPKATLFRLPFLLTLTLSAYAWLSLGSAGAGKDLITTLFFLFLLWIGFFIVYLFREQAQFRILSKKLIECCKRW